MPNNIYNTFGNNQLAQVRENAMRLKQTLGASPQSIVQNLLNSGQMSQTWFNNNFAYASQLGEQLKNLK